MRVGTVSCLEAVWGEKAAVRAVENYTGPGRVVALET